MNGRRSRRRRRERSLAARGLPVTPSSTAPEQLIQLRKVRDAQLADSGRRRSADLAQLDAYYGAEVRQIWTIYRELERSVRAGIPLEAPPMPQPLPAKVEKLTWLGRLRLFFRRPEPLPEIP